MLVKNYSRVQKPRVGHQLNRGNPLTGGLVLCYPFNENGGTPKEVSKRYATTFVVPTDISWNNSLPGPGLRFAANANRHYVDCGNRSEVDALANMTIFTRVLTTTISGGGNNIRNIIDKNSTNNGWILRMNTVAGSVWFAFFIHNGAYRSVNTANGTPVANVWYNICCIWNNQATNNQKIIVFAENSSLLTKVVASQATGNITAAPVPISIGGNQNTGDSIREWQGDIALAYFWNRALSDAEVMALLQNPYQIFLPRQRQIYIPPIAFPLFKRKEQTLIRM